MKQSRSVITISSLALMLVLVLVSFRSVAPNVLADERIKAGELVSKHLEAIGAAETRASVKSRIINGTCRFSYQKRGTGFAEGRAVLASEGAKSLLAMSFESPDYPREVVGFDGKKVSTSYISPGVRTPLGNFLYTYDAALREGLIGGALSSAWPLLDVAAKNPKLDYAGTKTIQGKETHVLRYNPRKGTDFAIKLYFDSATFQHVRTEYELVVSAQMGRTPDASPSQTNTRYKMVEEFSDFRKESGLTLPHSYRLEVSFSGVAGSSQYEWALSLAEFGFNQRLDPQSFNMEDTKPGA